MQMKTKRVRVANILSEAADHHLLHEDNSKSRHSHYSCVSVQLSAEHHNIHGWSYVSDKLMKRQGCRYMWLKMLAEYAESEQIEAKEFIG